MKVPSEESDCGFGRVLKDCVDEIMCAGERGGYWLGLGDGVEHAVVGGAHGLDVFWGWFDVVLGEHIGDDDGVDPASELDAFYAEAGMKEGASRISQADHPDVLGFQEGHVDIEENQHWVSISECGGWVLTDGVID